jgi:hypothetical protein
VVGCCDCGNKLSGCTKCVRLLRWLSTLVSQEGLSSQELFSSQEGLIKATKSIMILDIPTEIRIKSSPNKSLKLYTYTNKRVFLIEL